MLTDDEVREFFASVEKDADGNIGWDQDENRPANENPDEYRKK